MFCNRIWVWACVGLMAASLATAGAARADMILTDDGSTATIDPDSQAGMKSWIVDGVEHLQQQWFWYRAGSMTSEKSIDTLTLDLFGTTDTNFDGDHESAFIRYVEPDQFKIEIYFTLNGGTFGSETADIAESIEITNLSGSALDFHFFQYVDFDLNDTDVDASVEIIGGNLARQVDGGHILSETVEVPGASHFEVAVRDDTLAKLNDANADTLSDVAGPLTNDNLTWSFQWDFTVGAGRSFLISKDKLITPEPGTMALLGLGAATLFLRRRRTHKV